MMTDDVGTVKVVAETVVSRNDGISLSLISTYDRMKLP
jgi:hypothetical protein